MSFILLETKQSYGARDKRRRKRIEREKKEELQSLIMGMGIKTAERIS